MNIYKEDSYFVIEHIYDDGRSNARLNLPFNSVYLENIEDNVVLIRSAKNNDVICTTTLDNLTINDEAVSLETLYEDFDAVATAAGGGPGPGPTGPDWFTITNLTAEDANLSFTFGHQVSFSCDISYDGETWTHKAESTKSLTIPGNGKIYFKNGDFPGLTQTMDGFTCDKEFKVGGNIKHICSLLMDTPLMRDLFNHSTNLVYADELILPENVNKEHMFTEMFTGCTKLLTAPALNSTVLSPNYYRKMFQGCTSLTTAPALPATTLNTYCYYQMFDGCTSLTTAPELTAPSLLSNCYQNMFNGCSSLNHIKCLATSISAYNALYNWVRGVSATGTFEKAAGVNWSTGNSGIPAGWTVIEI